MFIKDHLFGDSADRCGNIFSKCQNTGSTRKQVKKKIDH